MALESLVKAGLEVGWEQCFNYTHYRMASLAAGEAGQEFGLLGGSNGGAWKRLLAVQAAPSAGFRM